ncbi:MAG: hypothetical protein KKD12_04585, partial [Proteobacteria bacterium]|nr:hypothetical protein [Pseudomonadota bacterium]
MDYIAGYIGRKATSTANHIFNLFAFTYRILVLIFQRPKAGRALVRRVTLEQVYFTCVQALPIIIPIALVSGFKRTVILQQGMTRKSAGKDDIEQEIGGITAFPDDRFEQIIREV